MNIQISAIPNFHLVVSGKDTPVHTHSLGMALQDLNFLVLHNREGGDYATRTVCHVNALLVGHNTLGNRAGQKKQDEGKSHLFQQQIMMSMFPLP